MKAHPTRRSIGILVCFFPLGLLLASLVRGLNHGEDKYSGIWWMLAAAGIALINIWLSYLRFRFFRWRTGSWSGYTHISALPAIGTLLVLMGGIVGFGAWVSAVVGIAASFVDTGGLPWFLVSTWNTSFWDWEDDPE